MRSRSKWLLVCLSVAVLAAVSLSLGAGVASAHHQPGTPLGGCGNGWDLVQDVSAEHYLGRLKKGNVNWDGYVCYKRIGNDKSRYSSWVTDNNRQSG